MIRLHRPLPAAGDAVLVVPGIGSSLRSTRPLLTALGDTPFSVALRRPSAEAAPHTSVDELAAALGEQITAAARPDRVVLVGHSFGALVALELLRILERGTRIHLHGLVAAQPAPQHLGPLVSDGDDADVLRAVCGDAVPQALTSEPRLAEYLARQWRADFLAIEAFARRPVRPIDTGLTVLTGTADPETRPPGAVDGWALWTSAEATFAVVEGGHDFPFTAAAQVARHVRRLTTDLLEVQT